MRPFLKVLLLQLLVDDEQVDLATVQNLAGFVHDFVEEFHEFGFLLKVFNCFHQAVDYHGILGADVVTLLLQVGRPHHTGGVDAGAVVVLLQFVPAGPAVHVYVTHIIRVSPVAVDLVESRCVELVGEVELVAFDHGVQLAVLFLQLHHFVLELSLFLLEELAFLLVEVDVVLVFPLLQDVVVGFVFVDDGQLQLVDLLLQVLNLNVALLDFHVAFVQFFVQGQHPLLQHVVVYVVLLVGCVLWTLSGICLTIRIRIRIVAMFVHGLCAFVGLWNGFPLLFGELSGVPGGDVENETGIVIFAVVVVVD